MGTLGNCCHRGQDAALAHMHHVFELAASQHDKNDLHDPFLLHQSLCFPALACLAGSFQRKIAKMIDWTFSIL